MAIKVSPSPRSSFSVGSSSRPMERFIGKISRGYCLMQDVSFGFGMPISQESEAINGAWAPLPAFS